MEIWVNWVVISDALSVSKRAVNMRAAKESWTKRKRKGRGGGFEYLVAELPFDVQQALAKREASSLPSEQATESAAFIAGKAKAAKQQQNQALDEKQKQRAMECGAAELMQLTGKARLRAEVKLAIINSYHSYLVPWLEAKQKVNGEKSFADDYNNRKLAFDADSYSVVESIRWNTPRKWIKILETSGAAALGGRYAREVTCKIEANSSMLDFAKGLLYLTPDIGGRNLHRALIAESELGDLGWDVPVETGVRRWLTKFKKDNPLLMEQLNNPDAFKSNRQVAWGKMDGNITRINQLWELDSTPSDVHLLDGRYSIVGAIDVFSRRPIVILHKTSSAEAVCLLMRKALLTFGVPEAVKTDNGKDYTSKRVVSVLSSLGIQQIITPPFQGDKKPHIERFFRTWAHGISKLLPGYGGHDVAARQKLQARASFADQIFKKSGSDIEIELTSSELAEIIDDWIEHYYNHETHRSIKAKPIVKWHSQLTTIRNIENERALDILLSPVPAVGGKAAGVRVATKDVGIEVQGHSFFAPELGAFIGQDVFCSWNPENAGEIFVFNSIKLEFICKAICPELAELGMSLADLSREAKKQQAAAIAQEKAKLRKASRPINPGNVAKNVIAAAKKRHSSVTGMPLPMQSAQSGFLNQADQASTADEQPTKLSTENFLRLRQEQIELDKANEVAQNAKPRFRSDFEEFSYLLQQQRLRQLTAEEIIKMNDFRKAKPKFAKQAESMLQSTEIKKASK